MQQHTFSRSVSPRLLAAVLLATIGAIGSMVAAARSASTMSTAATAFLGALTPEQRQQATFAFDTDERLHWHFIPTEMFPRTGLLIRDLTPAQRTLAHDLMKASLSQRGYMTASQIMDLENVLNAIEAAQRAAGSSAEAARALERNPQKYFFSVFGTPSPKSTWGW